MKFNPFFMFSREESETKVANDRLLSYAAGLTGQNMTYGFVSSRLFVYLNTILKIPSEKPAGLQVSAPSGTLSTTP